MDLKHVKGKSKGHVVLYALSTCGWCRKTKRLLNDLGVEYYYTDVDLLEENEKDEVMKIVKRHNSRGSFPTLVIDDNKCIVGYEEEEIKRELGK
jgi:glutaredoxin-like protein NrdH